LTEFATGIGEDVGGNVLLGNQRFAYIDGVCEVSLPVGLVHVEVSKGFEYVPLDEQIALKQGQLSVRLALERWSNTRRDGWYSGDARAHFLSPQAALLEAAAEDVAVVNLLAIAHRFKSEDGRECRSVPNILAFSGQCPAAEKDGHLVVVNTLNRHAVLGSLGLLNCHRPVYPMSFGSPESLDDWTMANWCDQCHRKGGLVVWAENNRTLMNSCGLWGEVLADVFLGKIDALETDFNEVGSEDLWWDALLSCGLRIPLVGTSGKDSNRQAVGTVRTFARLNPGEVLTYKNWIEAVRAGRTYVSNGPLVSLVVEGQDPGAVIDLPSGKQTVQIRAEARSWYSLKNLCLLLNGDSAAVARAAGSPSTAVLEMEMPVTTSGWIRAVCEGERDPLEGRVVQAITSPVYVNILGRPPIPKPPTARRIDKRFNAMLEWVHTKGRFENDQHRDRLAGIFLAAKDELARRANG
jgi:hypothetical protein